MCRTRCFESHIAYGVSRIAYRISHIAYRVSRIAYRVSQESEMPFRFEGLEIWHKAREFSAHIYEVTASFRSTSFTALPVR